jgi:hypothetical protein
MFLEPINKQRYIMTVDVFDVQALRRST